MLPRQAAKGPVVPSLPCLPDTLLSPYEAKDLPDGYRASVEYTLLADRDGVSGKENREKPVLLLFTDISADQRREHAEKKG